MDKVHVHVDYIQKRKRKMKKKTEETTGCLRELINSGHEHSCRPPFSSEFVVDELKREMQYLFL